MTTTISKHEVQQQQQQQQQLQQQTFNDYSNATHSQFDTLNNNEHADKDESDQVQSKGFKRRSLLNFKSFDFHIKSLYSGLRTGHKSESPSRSSSLGAGNGLRDAGLAPAGVPRLRIEVVDAELDAEQAQESLDLLLDYTQSPFTPRRDSSTLLLPTASLSPYYLSPYMAVSGSAATAAAPTPAEDDSGSGNIRRSSTSDIVSCRRRGSTSSSSSRRPSTSDLLRRARERRSSGARMGRSVSHSAVRSGGGAGGCMGGRRTSMAF